MSMHDCAASPPIDLMNRESSQHLKLDIDRSVAIRPARSEFGALVGESAAMRTVFAAIERIATTNAPVLILGESGTGKELAARTIHQASSRGGGPFEVVDCSRLSDSVIDAELFGREGAFGRADRGTLFLDEIGNLPLAVQPRLLRALGEQETRLGAARTRRVDLRIVASTNRDFREHVNSGQFRADLYYRLAVVQIRMPPLRERPEDISPLVRVLLPQIARERDLELYTEPDDQMIESLGRHSWPGNVRELRNCLEQLVILRAPPEIGGHGPAIDGEGSDSGPSRIASTSAPLDCSVDAFEDLQRLPFRVAKALLVERFERLYIARLLQTTGGNVAEAARRAGIDRVTLFRAIHRLNHQALKASTDSPPSPT
jgi:two-component system, NtrC family, response regulator GlrR